MGREERAKEERADLRRVVFEEAIARVGEIEETLLRHKATINQQGRALEALANVITSLREDEAARLAAARSWWFRLRRLVRRAWEDGKRDARKRQAGGVTVTHLPDDPVGVPGDPMKHVHQYEQDGPCFYRCMAPECGHRATLDDIARERDELIAAAAKG